jgi:hypothetical protein
MGEGDDPWGDYGRILVHGMTGRLARRGGKNGQLQLERTGPFVPPITFPGIGDVIVTAEMKQAMERAGFRGLEFRSVQKKRIVSVPWHEWDRGAQEPSYFPDESEPENYVLAQRHDPQLAEAIGEIWEVVRPVEDDVLLARVGARSDDAQSHDVKQPWTGADLFRVSYDGHDYVSARARRWFEAYFPEWTSFREVAR